MKSFESFPTEEPEGQLPAKKIEARVEIPTPPQPKDIEQEAGKRDQRTEEEKKEWSKRVDEIGREETEKQKPEVLRMVTRGLGDLFELLPKNREASSEDIAKLIEHTELQIMLLGMREKFAREIIAKRIHRIEDKAQFISESLDTDAIKMFVHLESLKASTDDVLRRLREERESAPQKKTPSEK